MLEEILNKQLDRLDEAQKAGTAAYSLERPLDIIVLTDGVPGEISIPILSLISYVDLLSVL